MNFGPEPTLRNIAEELGYLGQRARAGGSELDHANIARAWAEEADSGNEDESAT